MPSAIGDDVETSYVAPSGKRLFTRSKRRARIPKLADAIERWIAMCEQQAAKVRSALAENREESQAE
jgi:hypothetical protein